MKISAAKFKTTCLNLMDRVQKTHEEIIITKHGKPVAKLMAVESLENSNLFGYLKGRIKIEGDIVSSTGAKWNED
ncbi:type II toxin-antitoxin system Phd/YefM family antitoxin [Leptospira inadai]|nr:type II toxin-antitoxin system Phd/YefM family antitoxin [Leptospira inadai]PNV76130.1 type II toxin-antitoxin system prevent-host-death family antitoxin [Leptospira inadai serovar Lyme]